MRKISTEEFINKAKYIHDNKYDYSKVEYITAKNKVSIICPKHGEFWQSPDNHLHGRGCPICRYITSSSKNRDTLEEFITKARMVHNDKYDYSKVEYKNNRTKVCIVCPKHGEFWQNPDGHILRKNGCPHCSGNAKRTIESFISDATIVHQSKYSYDKSIYNGIHTPLIINCPIHGEFWQRPNDHLRGQGCPHCKQSKIEKEIFDCLTKMNLQFVTQYQYDETNRKNRIDFFIPSTNIAIECQGEQHFKQVDFANKGAEWAKQAFEDNIKRDKYKSDLCKKKGITLIYYIPKKNTVPNYKSSLLFENLYNNNNVCNTLKQIEQKIS